MADIPLPGTVLEPPTPGSDLFNVAPPSADFDEQFQEPTITEPNISTPAPSATPTVTATSEADVIKKQIEVSNQEIALLKQQLAEKAKFDPLIDMIGKDPELVQTIKAKFSNTPQPLVMPQKPTNYSEAEAYTNQESDSFKHRVAMDNYRDQRLVQLEQQTQRESVRRQQEIENLQRQQAEAQRMAEFKKEALAKGIPEDQFPEFFSLVNEAKPDDLVEYFKYKKSKVGPAQVVPGFGGSSRSVNNGNNGEVLDLGNQLLELSRSIM